MSLGQASMTDESLQLRFHGGHQQRYFSNRSDLLECIVRISSQARDVVFEVWKESEPVVLSDGRKGGKRYTFLESFDLSQLGTLERIMQELQALSKPSEER